MTDYADAGYQLQHYKITFYADNNGKIPLKVVRRAFASYDCAKKWEAKPHTVIVRNAGLLPI